MNVLTILLKSGLEIRAIHPEKITAEVTKGKRNVGTQGNRVIVTTPKYLRVTWPDLVTNEDRLWVFPMTDVDKYKIREVPS